MTSPPFVVPGEEPTVARHSTTQAKGPMLLIESSRRGGSFVCGLCSSRPTTISRTIRSSPLGCGKAVKEYLPIAPCSYRNPKYYCSLVGDPCSKSRVDCSQWRSSWLDMFLLWGCLFCATWMSLFLFVWMVLRFSPCKNDVCG